MREGDYGIRRQRNTDMPNTPGSYRFFKTIAGPGATAYPSAADDPTVYYAVMLKNVSYTETVGSQALTATETTTNKHIFNLATEDYIEENSIVLCFLLNGQWYTIDKVKSRDMVIVGHSYIETSEATGVLSAIDFDGNLLWTVDLGTEAITGRRKRPVRVRFDSAGDIIVVWDTDDVSTFLPDGMSDGPSAGVTKLNSRGVQIWEYTGEDKSADYGAYSPAQIWGNGLAIAGDDSIWFGSALDVNNDWLHHLDTDGTLIASFGIDLLPGEPLSEKDGQVTSIEVDADGNVWFLVGKNSNTKTGPIQIDSNGNVLFTYPDDVANLAVDYQVNAQQIALTGDGGLLIAGLYKSPSGFDEALPFIQQLKIFDGTLVWDMAPNDFRSFNAGQTLVNSFDLVADSTLWFLSSAGWTDTVTSPTQGVRFDLFSGTSAGVRRFESNSTLGRFIGSLSPIAYAGGALFRLERPVVGYNTPAGGINFGVTPGSANLQLTTGVPHDFKVGDVVQISGLAANLPTPLQPNTNYWVVAEASTTLQVSASEGGAAITITGYGGSITHIYSLKRVRVPAVERTDTGDGDRVWQTRLGEISGNDWYGWCIAARSR